MILQKSTIQYIPFTKNFPLIFFKYVQKLFCDVAHLAFSNCQDVCFVESIVNFVIWSPGSIFFYFSENGSSWSSSFLQLFTTDKIFSSSSSSAIRKSKLVLLIHAIVKLEVCFCTLILKQKIKFVFLFSFRCIYWLFQFNPRNYLSLVLVRKTSKDLKS